MDTKLRHGVCPVTTGCHRDFPLFGYHQEVKMPILTVVGVVLASPARMAGDTLSAVLLLLTSGGRLIFGPEQTRTCFARFALLGAGLVVGAGCHSDVALVRVGVVPSCDPVGLAPAGQKGVPPHARLVGDAEFRRD